MTLIRTSFAVFVFLIVYFPWGFPPTVRAEPPGVEMNLVESRKIWDAAAHNAFTDLVRFRDRWFCVFREGSKHVPGADGTIRVLRSLDGGKWESAALLKKAGIDLRDPKISITPDGRLMALMGGSVYSGDEKSRSRKRITNRSQVAFSADGLQWSPPQPVGVPEHQWLWRVTWHEGVGYGFSYGVDTAADRGKFILWKTRDGIEYERAAEPNMPVDSAGESALRFQADGTLLALARTASSENPTLIGRSAAPYDRWQWSAAGPAAQGPNFMILPDGPMLYAGRDYPGKNSKPSVATAKTVVGVMTTERCIPKLTLPSGGDTSYPGMVWHDNMLWLSYYSSHEGKAAIYLAKIRIALR
ncbi:MAG: exo-alpha-sialidase [Pirellulales bacterium]|nr:exo-alpha-sialidase [Pirellulales bacterium]